MDILDMDILDMDILDMDILDIKKEGRFGAPRWEG